jgi:multiple sugar transport system ATP-binding protein
MASVTLSGVEKIYDNSFKAVDDFNLTVNDKEFLVLVGPSGCGKSTTLRMIAGLEEITHGTITIGDTVVNDVPPKDRDIAMVFQNYALYPHMSVFDNMAFGLKLRKFPKKDIQNRVEEAAEILGITELLQRRPKQLSGGQRQRVALGRAIVRQPKVFLFDEPLSNLDAKMRVQMRVEINRLHSKLGATMIYVTHDQTEAMTMGDRIVVMCDGVIQQVDTPISLYDVPANKFVASFIGTPPMNFFYGTIKKSQNELYFISETESICLPESWTDDIKAYENKKVTFGIRPENIGSNNAYGIVDAPEISADVDVVEPMGSETYIYLKAGDNTFICKVDAHKEFKPGQEVKLPIVVSKAHIFCGETDKLII